MTERERDLHTSEERLKTCEFVEAAEKLLHEVRVRNEERAARVRRITQEPDFDVSDVEEDEAEAPKSA